MKKFFIIFSFRVLPFFFLALLSILAYSNTFGSPFVFDDHVNILLNPAIKLSALSLESIRNVSLLSPNKNRLLPNLSFALNYYVDGFNVFGFHLINISIHIATAFTFFLLAANTLQLARVGGRAKEIAFAAALLWAVHPLQTNGVTYIVQRMTSMATLFFLLSLLCYIKARIQDHKDIKKVLLFAASFFFGIMALLSKENSGMLPVMIVGYELFFLRGFGTGGKDRKKIFLLYAAGLLLFIIISFLFLGDRPLEHIFSGYGARDFTPGQRLLTETRIVFHYLTLLILPLPSRLNLAYDFPLSTGLLSPSQTLLAILGLIAMVTLIFHLYRRDRLTAFAIFWFLGNLLIESTLIPLELIFEHRMYMPSMFLILAAMAWCYRLALNKTYKARVPVIAIVLIFSFFTWQRNNAWHNEIRLWTDVVNKSPQLARAYVNLGKAYEIQNEHGQAEKILLQAIKLDPKEGAAFVNLGRVYERQNRLDEALLTLQKGLGAEKPKTAQLYNNMAVVYIRMKQYGNAVQAAKQAQRSNPYMADAYINEAIALGNMGLHEQAKDLFLKASSLDPGNGEPLIRLGIAYENLGDLDKALAALHEGLARRPANQARVYYDIGRIQGKLGNFSEAIAASNQALQLNAGQLKAFLTIGIAYEKSGEVQKAFGVYQEAWQKGLNMVAIINQWAGVSMQSSQPEKAVQYLLLATRMDPSFPATHENLGNAYGMMNLHDAAAREHKLAETLRDRR